MGTHYHTQAPKVTTRAHLGRAPEGPSMEVPRGPLWGPWEASQRLPGAYRATSAALGQITECPSFTIVKEGIFWGFPAPPKGSRQRLEDPVGPQSQSGVQRGPKASPIESQLTWDWELM